MFTDVTVRIRTLNTNDYLCVNARRCSRSKRAGCPRNYREAPDDPCFHQFSRNDTNTTPFESRFLVARWMRCDIKKKTLCAALRSRRHRAQVLCDILCVRQAVTAAREDHRHSRRKAGGNATWSGKRTILRFPVASEVLEHSQPPTAVSIFCRQFVPSSLCGCGGAYDAFACCASLNLSLFFFFALSHFEFFAAIATH